MRALRLMAAYCVGFAVACGRVEQIPPVSQSTVIADGGSSQAPADAGVPGNIDDAGPHAGTGAIGLDAGADAGAGAIGSDAGTDGGAAAEATPWPQPIAADPGVWIPVGPGGASVLQITVKPDDAQVALAATAGGLFRTTNAGVRWQDTGLHPSLGIRTVAFSAADPQRAWATDLYGALYSTIDGGKTWSAPDKSLTRLAPGWTIAQLISHPKEADTLYATTGGGLFVTRDAGKSWAALWVPKPDLGGSSRVCALAFAPTSPATMLSGPCGYDNYGGVHQSTDAGATWTKLNTEWGGVTALAFDPANPQHAYAALDYGGLPAVIRSHDGGQTWSSDGYSAPWTVRTLSVTSDGAIYAGLFFKGIAVSRDEAKSWSDASKGIPARSSAWVAMHPKTRAPFVAGLEGEIGGGGVYRAVADGWQRSSAGIFGESIRGLAWTRAGRLYAATDSGLFFTDDGGASWGATTLDQNTASVATDADDNLYVADWYSLWRSSDGGRSWKQSSLAEAGPHLAVAPQVPGRLYGYRFGLTRSDDGGASWRSLISGGSISAFAADPFAPLRLYAWSEGTARAPDGSFIIVNPGLRRSEDGGATWVLSQQGLPSHTGCVGIVSDPSRAGRLFAALFHDDADGKWGAVYRSDDSGLDWTAVLRRDGERAQAIALGPDGALLAAFPSTVARSEDEGKSWRDVAQGHAGIQAMLPDQTGSALYGATDGESLLRVVLTPPR